MEEIVAGVIDSYHQSGTDVFISHLHAELLQRRIRFPLLEFAAMELFNAIPDKKQHEITDRIFHLKEIGSNVVARILLQQRLSNHFPQSIKKAVEYIISGNEWYVCDIIGERVMGYALLTDPEKAIPILKKLSKHKDKWIVRSIGVATHYALKKGLQKKYVAQQFQVLLSLSDTTDFHTKKGVGWAVKTIAKFHPDAIKPFQQQINNSSAIKQWFKTKIRIGLGRSSKYATRYTG